MGFSNQAIMILIILLPGFVMLSLYHELSIRKQMADSLRIVYSLVFSAVFYGIQNHFGYTVVIIGKDEAFALQKFFAVPIRSVMIGGITIAAIPILLAMIRNHDLMHKILRKFKITRSTSRDSTWLEALESIDTRKQRIRVIMDDDKSYTGYISMHSDNPDEKTMCLTQVYYEKSIEHDPVFLQDVQSIMFVNLKSVRIIEIHKPENHRKEVNIWQKIRDNQKRILKAIRKYGEVK